MALPAFFKLPFGRTVAVLASIAFHFAVTFTSNAFADNWSGTGSPGQGGLIRALVADGAAPGVLYAAVYGGGIFKSTNGGATWSPVNNGLSTKRVMSLDAEPGTALGTLLAGTEGGGIFRSVDGGATWTPSNTGLQCKFVRALTHVPLSTSYYTGSDGVQAPNFVYAGTQCDVSSGAYKSRDGGLTWTQLNLPVANTVVNSISVRGDGRSVRLATIDGPMHSSDAGLTWSLINGTSPNVLSGPNGPVAFHHQFVGSGVILVSVEGTGVFRSSDQGLNWFPANAGLPVVAGLGNPLLTGGISMIAGTAYVSVPGYGVFMSTDQGLSWSPLGNSVTQLPFVRFIEQDPVTPTTFYAATFAGVYKSLDSGLNWTNISSGLGGGFAHRSATDPNNASHVLAAADTIHKSINGGINWYPSGTGLTSPPTTVAYVRSLPNTALAGTFDGGVFRTTNGGATWTPSNAGLPAMAGMDARLFPDPIDPLGAYVTLVGRGLYFSVDGGLNWTSKNGNLSGSALRALSVAIDPVTPSTLYLNTLVGLYKSVDAGAAWTLQFSYTMGNRGGNVSLDPASPSTLFLALFSPDASGAPGPQSGVWKSLDGGNTWTLQRAGLAMSVAAVRDAGVTTVHAAFWDEGSGGVYTSNDGGSTWAAANAGLGSNYVRSFETDLPQQRVAHAATFGNGIVNYVGDTAAALSGINTLLANLANTINVNSATLSASHLLPYFDPGFLNNGFGRNEIAGQFAFYLQGGSITSAAITEILSVVANASGTTASTIGSVSGTTPSEGAFTESWDSRIPDAFSVSEFASYNKPAAGGWGLYGNQQIAHVAVRTPLINQQCGGTCDGVRRFRAFQATAKSATIQSVVVTGENGAFPSAAVPLQQTFTDGGLATDYFNLWPNAIASFPSTGTAYTFTVIPLIGPPRQYVTTIQATTAETIQITNPTLHTLAAANLGSPLTVNWTLPVTFTVSKVDLEVNTVSSAGSCNPVGLYDLPPATNSRTITIPATCNGQPVADSVSTRFPVEIRVTAHGINGEETQAEYDIGTPLPGGGGDTTPPSVPAGVTANAISSTQINIAWNTSTDNVGVVRYMIYRGGVLIGAPVVIDVTDACIAVFPPTCLLRGSSYSYPDAGLSASTTYSYTVAACDAAGYCSAQSASASATTQGSVSTPAAPTGLSGIALAATQVQLVWNASVGATSYGVYRATSLTGQYGQISTATSTTYGDTGVSPATTYYYRVSAINSSGESGLSSVTVIITTPSCPAGDCIAPAAPATMTAVANNPTQVTLTWSPSSDTGGSALANYRLFRKVLGTTGQSALIAVVSEAATSHVDTTVAPNTPYTYFVSACDGAGNCSVGSPSADVTPPAMGGSVQIVGPYATQRGGSSTYQAWYRAQGDAGTAFAPVSPAWSYPTGNASITGNTLTVSSSLAADEVNNLTATSNSITGSENVRLQANADHWVPASPAPGGDVRSLLTLGSGTTQILVAGIYGGGIYRSSDRGANWLPTFGAPQLIRAIRLIPDGSNRILLAATDGDGVYRSVDGGQTWTESNTGLDCRDIRSLAGHANVPASGGIPTTAYAGARCGLYRSTDAGRTWSKLTSLPATGPISALTASGGDANVHVGTYGEGYFRSTDGGATWQSVNTGLPNGASSKVLSLHRIGQPFAILASLEGDGVWKIDELGSSWVNVTGNLPSTRVQSGISSIGGAAISSGVYVSLDGLGIYKTTNNTANVGLSWSQWVSFASEPRLKLSRGGSLVFDSLGYLYQPTGAGVYRSSDNGLTWQAVNNGLPGGMVLGTFHDPANANNVFAVSDRVYKSTNGGVSWAASDAGIDVTTGHTGFFGTSGAITGNSTAIFVATANGGVYRSANGGASWSPANNGLPALVGEAPVIRSHPNNNNVIYLGYPNNARGAYQWNDALGSWTSISGNLSGNALYVGPVIVDSVSGALFAGTRAGLYRSNDNGATWTQLLPISSGRVNQVRVDTMATPRRVYWSVLDKNNLADSTSVSGLYRMPVDGVSGSQVQLLSSAHVQNFRIVNPGPPTVYAALWNHYDYNGPLDGIVRGFEDLNGVLQWTELNAGLSAPQIYSFEEAGDGKHVARASSVGGGVYYFAGDITPPTAPGTLTLTSAAASQVTFSWAASVDDSGALFYAVRRDGVFLPTGVGLTGLSFVDTGLTPSTSYSYQVYACDGSYNCSAPSAATFSTTGGPSDTTTPSVPAGLNITNLAATSLTLNWTASTDNVGVTAYRVFRGGVFQATVNSPTLLYNDSGLTASTPYSYTVAACDAAGNCSAQSSAASATTPATGSSSFTPALARNWNLLGNALNITLDVVATFGSPSAPVTGVTSNIASVWKWDAATQSWFYYSPSLNAAGLTAFTDSRGYQVLTSIGPGEGYWVNATSAITLPAQSGAAFYYGITNFAALPRSWNLIATADAYSPHAFSNAVVDAAPPTGGVNESFLSLWAWDAVQQTWYYYAPALENAPCGSTPKCGLPGVKSYVDTRGYLHFEDANKKLGIGVGFWVNRP